MLDFRLVYKGPLSPESASSGSGNVKQKHEIRKHLHLQLVELWKEHPDLRSQAASLFFKSDRGDGIQRIIPAPLHVATASNVKTWVQHIADDHIRCGHHFVPLVSIVGGFTCSLDILFLRRDSPGSLVKSGGDIDNRIKTLLDALTIRTNRSFIVLFSSHMKNLSTRFSKMTARSQGCPSKRIGC